jgi:hypothetical protein
LQPEPFFKVMKGGVVLQAREENGSRHVIHSFAGLFTISRNSSLMLVSSFQN